MPGVTTGMTLLRSATTVGIVDRAVTELFLTGRAFDQRDRHCMIDAELALEAFVRGLLAGQFEHQRVHLEVDALDLVRRSACFRCATESRHRSPDA